MKTVKAVADQMHKLNKCSDKQSTARAGEQNRRQLLGYEKGTEIGGGGELCGIDVDDTATGGWMSKAHATQSVNNNLHLRRYLNIVACQKQHRWQQRHQPANRPPMRPGPGVWLNLMPAGQC